MPLSEYESRVLEQFEHDFTITDPDLARWLATGITPSPAPAGRRLHLPRVLRIPRQRIKRLQFPRLRFPRLGIARLRIPTNVRNIRIPRIPRIASWRQVGLLPLLAVVLMIAGAALVGTAEAWRIPALFAAAGAAYLAGVVALIIWHRRQKTG